MTEKEDWIRAKVEEAMGGKVVKTIACGLNEVTYTYTDGTSTTIPIPKDPPRP